ncbi:hypothetical protein [Clostridium perfringens]|uniref:hypothetical protein n=1 Tax=Clostridium perfringens TaxID=1502 RepID=UPI002E78F2B6|nr:hypothetical protein [Clostridium perfringens]MBS5993707.1 hypothetical protein [Clostridium perfringens]WVH95208.1 hypothetical protein V0I27_10460 [Clostridium perfringens]HCG3020574.1 hypothetical protein [Clostridium perfringens]HCG3168376.1 hypothetical protein [Clostridium perfringens]
MQFWMFGSALKKDKPNDIDILLLYPINIKDIYGVYKFKKDLKLDMKEYFNIDIDLLLLSYEEEETINFKKDENCIFIF